MTQVFQAKLQELPQTAALENAAEERRLGAALLEHAGRPAIAVGSGGSAISAAFLAACRRDVSSAPTSVATPMDFVLGSEDVGDSQVWLFSGRGDNADVVACLDAASSRNVADLRLVTSNPDGRAALIAAGRDRCTVHYAPVAYPKDGFLSTHSLIAAMSLTLAAADIVSGLSERAEGSGKLSGFLSSRLHPDRVARFRDEFRGVGPETTIVILADPVLASAAIALETSIWECALCSVQRTDMRNFAHGRHVLLARRPEDVHLLVLTTFVSDPVWNELGAALPPRIRRTTLGYGTGSRRDLAAAIIDTLAIIQALGEIVGVDPGKPGVGDFAKSVYDGTSLEELARTLHPSVRHKVDAIRKSGQVETSLAALAGAHADAVERLREATFDTVILDYDGTIVTTEGRYSAPGQDVVAQLIRLLEAGVTIGIATGRGGSLGEALREAIPERFYDQVVVGYYNGGFVRPLGVDIRSDRPIRSSVIEEMVSWLKQSGDYPGSTRDSDLQLSITISDVGDLQRLENRIADFPGFVSRGVRVVRSKHSIDIGVATNTKLNVGREITQSLGKSDTKALCIGDSGHAGGNDFELLGEGWGISVDTVCHRPDGCWSLFPGRLRGPGALVRILEAIELRKDGTFQLALERLID